MRNRRNRIDVRKIGRIVATVALAGAIVALAGTGAAYAGCGGGGGGGGGHPMPEAQPQPPPKAMPKEVRDKLRKLRDLAERRESDIKHGAEPPLPEIEKSAMLLVLDSYKDYKDTPEYAQAWNAVVGAELAAGPH